MSEIDITDNQDNPEAEKPPEQNPWPSPGQKLKSMREDLGLSQARVAETLYLTVHYVNALENDEYHKLPGKIFIKGYIKSYARLLKTDEAEIIKCYEKFASALEQCEQTEARVIQRRKVHDQNRRWLIAAAIILVIVLALAWRFGHGTQSDAVTVNTIERAQSLSVELDNTPAPTAEVVVGNLESRNGDTGADVSPPAADIGGPDGIVTEAAAAGAPQQSTLVEATAAQNQQSGEPDSPLGTSAVVTDLPDYQVEESDGNRIISLDVAGDDQLEMHFSGTSWIAVDDGSDSRLYNDNLHAGDALLIKGDAPFNVLIGNAKMVELEFNSRTVDIMSRIRSDSSARIVLKP